MLTFHDTEPNLLLAVAQISVEKFFFAFRSNFSLHLETEKMASSDSRPIMYLPTVDAYNQWASVRAVFNFA